MSSENKVRTSITIDPGLWQHAKEYCKSRHPSDQMSFSSLVEKALNDYLFDKQLKDLS